MKKNVELGLGLIGIGRTWGFLNPPIPSEKQSLILLNNALNLGIRFFDTAPSYGLSEKRLGIFLKSLPKNERDRLIISTKFGEHWNSEKSEPFVNHSYDFLRASIDQSFARLGQIDIIQLHKTNPSVLLSSEVNKAVEYAKFVGVRFFGASVSDLESARLAISLPWISYLQLPYNQENNMFKEIFDLSVRQKKKLIINRPFNSGKNTTSPVESFRHILSEKFSGVILSGTTSTIHLRSNINSFNQASSS
jgi:aryl-alcohol dehydrogenase-like predicted oxidoreductase